MRYRAATALPYNDRHRATAGLRGHLRIIALTEGATPDWSTMVVQGPTETTGQRGRTWFEWSATVEATSEDTS